MTGIETVSPYGDVSFRILMKIADILMDRQICHPFDVIEKNSDSMEDIFKFQKKTY
jgi:hypothetical protein